MGLLTGLALAGGLMLGKRLGKRLGGRGSQQEQQQQQAQQPTVPVAPGSPLTGPQPPQVNLGANMAQANAAGTRTRKRAAAGNLLTPRPPKSDRMAVNPSLRPRTLIGY